MSKKSTRSIRGGRPPLIILPQQTALRRGLSRSQPMRMSSVAPFIRRFSLRAPLTEGLFFVFWGPLAERMALKKFYTGKKEKENPRASGDFLVSGVLLGAVRGLAERRAVLCFSRGGTEGPTSAGRLPVDPHGNIEAGHRVGQGAERDDIHAGFRHLGDIFEGDVARGL